MSDDKIRNPATGRWVSATGKIGKAVLLAEKAKDTTKNKAKNKIHQPLTKKVKSNKKDSVRSNTMNCTKLHRVYVSAVVSNLKDMKSLVVQLSEESMKKAQSYVMMHFEDGVEDMLYTNRDDILFACDVSPIVAYGVGKENDYDDDHVLNAKINGLTVNKMKTRNQLLLYLLTSIQQIYEDLFDGTWAKTWVPNKN